MSEYDNSGRGGRAGSAAPGLEPGEASRACFEGLLDFLEDVDFRESGLSYDAMYDGVESRCEALKAALTEWQRQGQAREKSAAAPPLATARSSQNISQYNTAIAEALFWLGRISEAQEYILAALDCTPPDPRASLVWSKILELSGHWDEALQVIRAANAQGFGPEHIAWESRILYVHRKRDSIRQGKTISEVIKDSEELLESALAWFAGADAGDAGAGGTLTPHEQSLMAEINYQYACMLQERAHRIRRENQGRFDTFEVALDRLRKARAGICPTKYAECDLMATQCLVEMARVSLFNGDNETFARFTQTALDILREYGTEVVDEGERTTYEFDTRTLVGKLAWQNERFMASLLADNPVGSRADSTTGSPAASADSAASGSPASDTRTIGDHMIEIMDNQDMRAIEREIFINKERERLFIREWRRIESGTAPVLHILQRWNSFTPIFGDLKSKGGGYFLDTGYSGLAIDPGFDFIKNFKNKDFFFGSIDDVIISHAHNDHAADLEAIITLLQNYNTQIKGDMHSSYFCNSASRQIMNCCGLKQSARDFERAQAKYFSRSDRHRHMNIYLTLSVYKKYMNLFDINRNSNYSLFLLDDDRSERVLDEGTRLLTLRAKHEDIISNNQCKGFLFKMSHRVRQDGSYWLLYTGDTGYEPQIIDDYRQISDAARAVGAPLVLLAHLGGFNRRERLHYWEATNPARAEEAYYPHHLGRLGLAQAIGNTQTALVIVSEWGEEFSGLLKRGREQVSIRKRICEIFQASFPDRRMIAADIGLTVKVVDGSVFVQTGVKPDGERADASAGTAGATSGQAREMHWSLFEDIDYYEDEDGRLRYRVRVP